MLTNTMVIFKAVPDGAPVPGKHMEIVNQQLDLDLIELKEGEFVLRNLYLSLDPYMRHRMRPQNVKSYAPAFKPGEVLTGHGVSEVEKSRNDAFKVGDIVHGMIGWENYTHVTRQRSEGEDDVGCLGFRVIKDARTLGIPLSNWVGVLGMPGMTAWVGLKMVGDPKPKETILISAASGAVGQLVGQLAKIKGLHVVGSVGNDKKKEYITKELKFDKAFNYKTVDIDEAIKEACPDGIDIYFENVGGPFLDTVLTHMNIHGRIPVCGMVSQYNAKEQYGVKNLLLLVQKRLRMQGFLVGDHVKQIREEFEKTVVSWLIEGKLCYREDIAEGITNAPEAFVGMLEGKNLGKQVVKIANLSH
jgi:NADPH-dependent curcumin reductase CurA